MAPAILLALPTVATAAPGPGDLPTWILVILSLVSQVVLWALMIRSGVLRKVDHAASEATASALQSQAIKALTQELGKIAAGLSEQSRDFQEHRLEDRELHARGDEIMRQVVETQTTLARVQESQQAQINHLARGLPPKLPTELAATRSRR